MTSGPSDWSFPRATFPGAPDIRAASGWHDEKTDGKNLESHMWHMACPSALGDGTLCPADLHRKAGGTHCIWVA